MAAPTMMSEAYSEDIADGLMVEVHVDQYGAYWVGVTTLRSPNDWTFRPRAQYGIGEGGRRMAIDEARSIAAGIRYDAAR